MGTESTPNSSPPDTFPLDSSGTPLNTPLPSPVQTPHPEQLGPTVGSAEGLDLVSAKDLAIQLTDHDWNLFNSIHQVRGAEPRGGQQVAGTLGGTY